MAEHKPVTLLAPGQLIRVRGDTTLDGEAGTILRQVGYDPDFGISRTDLTRGRMYKVLVSGQSVILFEDELRVVD
jgi:hypothetical protein